jgi:hypothetical protein
MRRDDRQPNAVFSYILVERARRCPRLDHEGHVPRVLIRGPAVQGDRRRRAAWELLKKTDEGHR